MSFPGRSPLYAVPSAAGAAARMACARLHAAGLPLASLLEKAGLTADEVEDPRRRIEVSAQVKFLKIAADALQDDLLGFHRAHGKTGPAKPLQSPSKSLYREYFRGGVCMM